MAGAPSNHAHAHKHSCDCAHHRAPSPPVREGARGWTAWLPALACLVCPACLATYAKVASLAGVSLGLSERVHLTMLAAAVLVSWSVSAWRSARTGFWWPVALATVGAALVALGHAAPSVHYAEYLGVITLLAGGLAEQFRLRRASVAPPGAGRSGAP